jgi:FkbM family methyltransferase
MGKLTAWLLKETKGVTLLDKSILLFLKIIYLVLRISIRIVLGKKRTDRLYVKRNIGFNSFLYKSLKFLSIGNYMLLKVSVPKYNYKFYCRINNEDYTFMTGHEDEIEGHFNPKEGDIVVDVGAHIGAYTIIGSKRVGLNGKVVSIEADPDNFDLLNRNIQLNKLSNVMELNYAVYSEEKILKLYLPSGGGEESSYTKYNTIMYDRALNEEKFVEAKANTLGYLLLSNMIKQEDVNWVKIDVEGAEYEVLKGAKDVLSKCSDITLLIEIHNLSAGYNLYKPISEFLSLYNIKIEFEKASESGERHVIAR